MNQAANDRHILVILLFAVLIGVTPLTARGQFEALEEGQSALQAGKRLRAVQLIQEAAKKQPELKDMLYQFLPVISDYTIEVPLDQAQVTTVTHSEYVDDLTTELAKLQRHAAIERIVQMAKDRQIVILNEAHDTPQHRAIGMQLSEALRQEGFEFLALEALFLPEGKSGIVDLTCPVQSTGHYTLEPVFGDFVRQAVVQGYQLVAYEIEPAQRPKFDPSDPYASVIVREEAQANNVIKAVLNDHPQAKIFVYVGYSHAREDWQTLDDGRELGWFAAQLQRKTGIDPLTIDQVGGTYNIKSGQVDCVYDLLHRAQPFDQPTVVSRADGSWVTSDQYHDQVDLTLFLPPQQFRDGRPDWLTCGGYRQPVTVSNDDYYLDGMTLLQAFLQDEPEDAIPVDQVIIERNSGSSTLLLPPGRYRLIGQQTDGTAKELGTLQVDTANDQ